jgi:hypothetical protein
MVWLEYGSNTFCPYHFPTGGRSALTRTIFQETVEQRAREHENQSSCGHVPRHRPLPMCHQSKVSCRPTPFSFLSSRSVCHVVSLFMCLDVCVQISLEGEVQFTVLTGQGIKQWEKRVPDWVAKVLPLDKSGVCGEQVRVSWSTEEDTHRRPGHHWLKRRDLNTSHTMGCVGRNKLNLITGLVVTLETRDLVRRERNQRT